MKRYYPVFGIVLPLFYLSAVLISGFLRSDYSHVSNAISELIVADAPNKLIIDIILILYNSSIVIFGFSSFFYIEKAPS